MNFFEQELRKLFDDGQVIGSPTYSGRACFGTLGKDLRVRAEFVTTGYADNYDALKLTVLDRANGPVDKLTLYLKDLLGMRPVPGNPNFPEGVIPHIWVYQDKTEWYGYQPVQADRKVIRQAVEQYLSVFRDRSLERDSPKLVYICAPLRGDVEQNIAFAKEKAREVFESGDIPICPHLMFPPIADPNHSGEDQKAREMGLRLIESCQQVNVYSPIWSEGMWAEINHASELGIPLRTGQETIGKSPMRTGRKQVRR